MEKPEKTTLRTLAQELGVAHTTVMRALNNHKSVSTELRRHIISHARKAGYNLPGSKQKSVALITSNFNMGGYVALVIAQLGPMLEKAGYRAEILTHSTLPRLNEFSIAGGISLELVPGLEKYWAQEFSIPMVALNMPSYNPGGIYSVCSDESTLTGRALNYLYDLGHRKIAVMLFSTRINPIMKERENIARKFFMDKGIAGECMICLPDEPEENIRPLVKKAAESGVTAILSGSESMSHVIMGELYRLGRRIPEDCSVIGFEWGIVSGDLTPPLTTVSQDFKGLAEAAVSLLLQRIQGDNKGLHDIYIPGKLIERASCRKVLLPPD